MSTSEVAKRSPRSALSLCPDRLGCDVEAAEERIVQETGVETLGRDAPRRRPRRGGETKTWPTPMAGTTRGCGLIVGSEIASARYGEPFGRLLTVQRSYAPREVT